MKVYRDMDGMILVTAIELKVKKLCLPSPYGLDRLYTVEKKKYVKI